VNIKEQPTIVFVDDESAILSSLRSLFRREGYVLHFFQFSSEALVFLQDNPVDVIVTDMRMPDMSGADFLKQAARLRAETVRIMLSGHEDKAVVIRALADGLAHYYVLKPWDDVTFRTLMRQAVGVQQSPLDLRLKEIFGSSTALPSQPKFHTRLLQLLSKEGSSLNEIVEEVEGSPALVAKLLRTANSIYISARNHIATVREAALFIGVEYIVHLVAAIEAFQNVSRGIDHKHAHVVDELWSRSLRRAAIAKAIAERWKGSNNNHLAYVASLLQDIGYIARLYSDPEKYLHFLELAKGQARPIYDTEGELFGTRHDEVGAALLDFWNFPHEIVDAVALHHGITEGRVLVQVLQIADALVCNEWSAPHDPAIDPLIAEWRERLGQQLSTQGQPT
jgi:putative nucleotidyltransferase with HDIG domain